MNDSIDAVAQAVGKTRDRALESTRQPLVAKVVSASAPADVVAKVQTFVTYMTPTTKNLGSGEAAGTVNSFRAAFGKDPVSATDWQDVIKIANGRFPTQTSTTRETAVAQTFAQIYKRAPDRGSPNDNAAIVIMAYGLRQADGFRDFAKERAGIVNFRGIFGRAPVSASDWDSVRAIAYSGAKR